MLVPVVVVLLLSVSFGRDHLNSAQAGGGKISRLLRVVVVVVVVVTSPPNGLCLLAGVGGELGGGATHPNPRMIEMDVAAGAALREAGAGGATACMWAGRGGRGGGTRAFVAASPYPTVVSAAWGPGWNSGLP